MHRNEYLKLIRDRDSSLVIGRIIKLKDAPYDKALVLVENSLDIESVSNIGGINIVRLQYGSVFLKASSRLVRMLGSDEEMYESRGIDIKYRLIPSHLNLDNMATFERNNLVIRANKRVNIDAQVVMLDEVYIGENRINEPRKRIKSSGALTLPELIMSDVEIVRSDARDDVKYVFSLKRDLTVKVTPYCGLTKIGESLTQEISWGESPIKNGKHFITRYEDVCYRPYIKSGGLETRLDNFLRMYIDEDRNDFIDNIYELVDSKLFNTGILTPEHLASYLLEYVGISGMSELVKEYNEGGVSIKTLDRVCKTLPKKLYKYFQVLQDLHRVPNTKIAEDSKSNIFSR